MHHGRSHRRRLRSSYDGNMLRGRRRTQGRAAQVGVLRERHAPAAAGLGWRLRVATTSASATRLCGGESVSVR